MKSGDFRRMLDRAAADERSREAHRDWITTEKLNRGEIVGTPEQISALVDDLRDRAAERGRHA